jgi:hypothetical protein
VSQQVLQIEVPVKVLMYHTVPFAVVFVESTRVPEILIELSIGELVYLCIEIRCEIEYHEKADEEGDHDGLIPAREEIVRIQTLIPEAHKRETHTLLKFVHKVLSKVYIIVRSLQ